MNNQLVCLTLADKEVALNYINLITEKSNNRNFELMNHYVFDGAHDLYQKNIEHAKSHKIPLFNKFNYHHEKKSGNISLDITYEIFRNLESIQNCYSNYLLMRVSSSEEIIYMFHILWEFDTRIYAELVQYSTSKEFSDMVDTMVAVMG